MSGIGKFEVGKRYRVKAGHSVSAKFAGRVITPLIGGETFTVLGVGDGKIDIVQNSGTTNTRYTVTPDTIFYVEEIAE